MRQGEGEQVVETFRRHQGIELIHVRAADRFFERLEGVTDPEDKRKAIGELFIRIFEDAVGRHRGRPVPRAGHALPRRHRVGHRATRPSIKSHHNVGGLPEDMDFELVEPLRALFKDEVRAVGTELGLPDEIVWRQPFPGPGLGVRIIGEVTPEKVAILQHADAIVREEIRAAGLEREIWQAFAVLPDIRSRRRDGRRAHLRLPDHHPGGHQRGRHDRRLGPPALRPARARCRAASSTRCPASTGWPTTSRPSRPAPSSGSSRRGALSVALGAAPVADWIGTVIIL